MYHLTAKGRIMRMRIRVQRIMVIIQNLSGNFRFGEVLFITLKGIS